VVHGVRGISTAGTYSYVIEADSSGNCYVIGFFNTSMTIGSTTLTTSSTDAFVAKVNTSSTFQ
jgi:hypothetical protein